MAPSVVERRRYVAESQTQNAEWGDPKSRNDGTVEWRNNVTAENHRKS